MRRHIRESITYRRKWAQFYALFEGGTDCCGIEDPPVTAYPIYLTKYFHHRISKAIISFEGKRYRILLQSSKHWNEWFDRCCSIGRQWDETTTRRRDVAETNVMLFLRYPLFWWTNHFLWEDVKTTTSQCLISHCIFLCRSSRVWHCSICFHQCSASELYIDNGFETFFTLLQKIVMKLLYFLMVLSKQKITKNRIKSTRI